VWSVIVAPFNGVPDGPIERILNLIFGSCVEERNPSFCVCVCVYLCIHLAGEDVSFFVKYVNVS